MTSVAILPCDGRQGQRRQGNRLHLRLADRGSAYRGVRQVGRHRSCTRLVHHRDVRSHCQLLETAATICLITTAIAKAGEWLVEHVYWPSVHLSPSPAHSAHHQDRHIAALATGNSDRIGLRIIGVALCAANEHSGQCACCGSLALDLGHQLLTQGVTREITAHQWSAALVGVGLVCRAETDVERPAQRAPRSHP